MLLLSVYETVLYYCCLLFISHYILGYKPKLIYLCCSFILFIPLFLIALSGNNMLHNMAFTIFECAKFLLLRLIFKRISIGKLIYAYMLIFSINTVLTSITVPIFPTYYLCFDFSINTITFIICVSLCLTKARFWIQQIIEWTPKYISLIILLILIFSSVVAALIMGFDTYLHFSVWNHITQIFLSLMLVVICIVIPIVIFTAVSNNNLKTLTNNYEQQIRAQAEHYKALAAANFETRRFKHDFKNISIGIEKMLADGNYDQALNCLRAYNHALNAPGTFCPAFDTGNGIADALLSDKQVTATACNTVIVFQGAFPQDLLSPTDLCVILGNSLDNVIEACQKLSHAKTKTISISCTCNSGFLFLSVSNPVDQKVTIRDNYVVTTKENKTLHGFGLYSLHSVVKKYDGEVRLSSTDTVFTLNIDLCMVPAQKHENSLPH